MRLTAPTARTPSKPLKKLKQKKKKKKKSYFFLQKQKVNDLTIIQKLFFGLKVMGGVYSNVLLLFRVVFCFVSFHFLPPISKIFRHRFIQNRTPPFFFNFFFRIFFFEFFSVFLLIFIFYYLQKKKTKHSFLPTSLSTQKRNLIKNK